MYPTGLGVLQRHPITYVVSDRWIRPALEFCDEIQSNLSCWWSMYPTNLGVLWRDPITSVVSDRCIRPALVFCGEIQSNLGCSSFRRVFDQPWSFIKIILLFVWVFVLCAPSYSSLRGSVRVCFSSCFLFTCIFQARFIWCICSSLRGEC